MKFARFLKRGGFIAAVLIIVLLADIALSASGFIQKSGFFWLNDFEITRRDHPEKVWDRVIFGSSELVSAYREDLTTAGYVNLGVDYGTVRDLVEMLEGGHITVGSDLVLALNWGAMYDDMDTNPTYEWHRKWYEPYFYFQRDRLSEFVTDNLKALLGEGDFRRRTYTQQQKAFYYGNMTQSELDERREKLHGLYFEGGTELYADNLAALDEVFAFCEAEGIRVRVLWLPENPLVEPEPLDLELRELCREKSEAAGVEFYDMTDALDAGCFYDTGHLDYDYGAVVFTEVLDEWLLSQNG